MNIFLSHLNYMPFIYGIVLFISVTLIIRNVASGQIGRAAATIGVLWIGFLMHGDQAETRMGVAIAAVLLDISWPILMRK